MKIVLEFDNKNEAIIALKANKFVFAREEIWQKLFRPNNKNGYHNCDNILNSEEAYEIIEKLEKMYFEILEDHGVRDLELE